MSIHHLSLFPSCLESPLSAIIWDLHLFYACSLAFLNIADYFILVTSTGIISDIHTPLWSDTTRHLPIHYCRTHLD